MGKLSGKVALVTGAGSGFGESIAHSYVAEGANVLVADVAVENGKRVASEITAKNYPSGGKAVFVECNVIKKADWQAALDLAVKQFGQLDIVVNNAGTTYIKQESMGVTEEDFDKVMTVNTKSIYWSVAVVMPYFVERKSGVYLNTSSVAGTRVRPGQVWYGASKAWVNRITQGLAAEYGPYGIRINSVCPVRGTTALLEKFSGVPDSAEERARFAKTVPLGRQSEPEDVAKSAVFLACDDSSFISGTNLAVDGGRLAV
ncbi:hypothetical protein N7474_009460 [Penicillium riverlandense]|uniref:uncharacterized protein n=1 Tax=Penicillium riverlandense TaxID=1903569 RepID=UPI0025476143|nr:uncharacterized protein N7474_009460 [Penicillium riverlandense]KAJ5808191.1 hypothetical protein N7474_009460 [Penicillium riverlandense]